MFGPTDYFLFAVFATIACWERFAPGRQLKSIPFWSLKGILAGAVYWVVATYSPFLWADLLPTTPLIDGTGWPLYSATPAAFAVYQFGIYAWHRTMHAVPFLWRHFHQTHHSAERVDIWSALWFHPLDTAAFTLVGTLMVTVVLGVDPVAVLVAVLISVFTALFQHANIRTPRWIGFLIVRPESHMLHHERGVHRYNYCDLPLWDMVFGTFRNPKTWDAQAGLVDGGGEKYWSLLIGRDITRHDEGAPNMQPAE